MNDELKRNIGGVNRSNNTLDLQLFSSVSNPYTFTLNGDYNVNTDIEPDLVDLSYYFKNNVSDYYNKTQIPETNLKYLNSGLIAGDMDNMFSHGGHLISIPKLNINTSYVEDMHSMFQFCTQLISIDISNFDTSNVTNMESMFYECSSLKSLNLSNFDTSNVTSMESMFNLCTSLRSVNLSSFKINNLIGMSFIFRFCSSLTSLDLSNFDTSNVNYMKRAFYGCTSLTTITGIIDMKSCTSYEDMFYNCPKLTGVKIKNPPEGFDGAGLNSNQYTIVS